MHQAVMKGGDKRRTSRWRLNTQPVIRAKPWDVTLRENFMQTNKRRLLTNDGSPTPKEKEPLLESQSQPP